MENTNHTGEPDKDKKESPEDIKAILARLDASDARHEALASEQKRITSALDEAISGEGDEDKDYLDQLLNEGPPGSEDTDEGTPDMLEDPQAFFKHMEKRVEARLHKERQVMANIIKKEREAHKAELDGLRTSMRDEAQRVVNTREEYLQFMAEHPWLSEADAQDFVRYQFEQLVPEAEARNWPVERFREELGKRVASSVDKLMEAKQAYASGRVPAVRYGRPTPTSQPPAKSREEENAEALQKQFEAETDSEALLPHEELTGK